MDRLSLVIDPGGLKVVMVPSAARTKQRRANLMQPGHYAGAEELLPGA